MTARKGTVLAARAVETQFRGSVSPERMTLPALSMPCCVSQSSMMALSTRQPADRPVSVWTGERAVKILHSRPR